MCSFGATLQKILTTYIISSKFYEKKIYDEKLNNEAIASFTVPPTISYLHENYLKISSNMEISFRIPDELKHLIKKPKCNNMLNEIVFWCIEYEFPEVLVEFLLSLMPKHEYKIELTRSILAHYMYITTKILKNGSNDIINRANKIITQLFVNEETLKILLEECSLLPTFISSSFYIITTPNFLLKSRIKNNSMQLNSSNNPKHYVVDVWHQILQNQLYWLVIHNFISCLKYKVVTKSFLENTTIFNLWLNIISSFEAMNLIKKQDHTHVEYDYTLGYTSLYAEYQVSSSTVWALMLTLNDETTLGLTKNSIKLIEQSLFKWFETVGITSSSFSAILQPNVNQLSFNFPLHRFYSIFLYNFLFKQHGDLNSLLIYDDLSLISLASYPLQVFIGIFEVQANMWVYNGEQMKFQTIMYKNYFFNDQDLFLLQITLCCKLRNYELLMKILFDRFNVNEFVKIKRDEVKSGDYSSKNIDPKKQLAMLNSFLMFLLQMICVKPNLELENASLTRSEIISLLCIKDHYYSEIEKNLPDFGNLTYSKVDVEGILNDIADFIQPSLELHAADLKQGYYIPKDYIWLNEYDPLHVLMRSSDAINFNKSFDRYCEFIKRKNQNENILGNKSSLWPPFRLPNYKKKSIDYELLLLKLKILDTKTLHGSLFNLLYKHYHEEPLPESCLYFIIFIMELALFKVNK